MRATGLVALGLLAVAVPARADEPADRGISMSAWAGAAVDRSVSAADSGRPVHDGAPLVGATTIGNIGRLAMGGAIDATPGVLGNGQLSVAALLGFQPEVDRIRIQVLGEAGRHRFSDAGGTLLPYLGIRLGVTRTIPANGLFEVGAWLFGRYDIGTATVTSVGSFLGDESRTDYRVGGWMGGLALQVGLRLESADPRRSAEMLAAR